MEGLALVDMRLNSKATYVGVGDLFKAAIPMSAF